MAKKKAGTTASVIFRLEDADQEGNYLSMLRRIVAVLDTRVEIRLVSAENAKRPGSRRTA